MQKLVSTVFLALVVLAGNALAQTFTLKHTFLNPTPDPDDQFGLAVAVAGNKILTGAPRDDAGALDAGAAYVFDGLTGALLLTLANPTPDVNDQFGAAVAVVGSNFLVGAPGANSGSGEAYLFDGSTGALLQTFSNPGGGTDQFGATVAGLGSNVLIGAPLNSTGASNSGVAYLFDGSTGALLQTFLNPTPAISDQFGKAVAGFGNNVLVGAPLDDNSGRTDTGAAYLFDATTGTLLQTFLNPTPANADQFGGAVAGVDNSVFVGAAFDDASATNSGFAYRFDATTGALLNNIANPSPATADQFAFAVAAFGSGVLIGAPGANTASGEAYFFDGTGGLQQTFSNPTPASDELFGRAIAAAGSNIAVGAPTEGTTIDDIGPGAVYFFSSNQPPVADAGSDQTVEGTSPAGALVTLDGTGSTDADNDQLTYIWRENGNIIAGPTLSATSTATLGFGSHTIELTVDDGKGGTDTDEALVNVVDTTPPIITLNGANPLTLECHVDAYTEPGATVSDACDPSPAFVITGSVNAAVLGTYTITYTATDAHGNSATKTRTVHVVDTTPPAITLNGANPMTLECLAAYVEPNATVSDACDPSPALVISGSVNTNVPGIYTITYTATDASGNSASTTRTVNVDCPLPYPFVLLANTRVTIDHENASAGDIHSNDKIEFRDGNPSLHTGNLTAVGDITIRQNNTIDGNVTAGKNLVLESNATITGTATSHATVARYSLPTFSFDDGTGDVSVPANGSLSLAPGSRHDVKVGNGGSLSLRHDGNSGEYFFHKLELGTFAILSIDVSQGPVEINLVEKFHFAQDVKVVITPANEFSSRFVTFNVMGDRDIHIHERSNVSGNINTPNAKIILFDSVFFKGAIAAKEIEIRKNVTVLHHNSSSSTSLAKIPASAAGDAEESSESETVAGVKAYALEQNYPNPFNPETEIRFALPEAGHVTVKIFNTLGETVRTLTDQDFAAGTHAVRWNAQNDRGQKVPSGLYFYQLVTQRFTETKRMILAK
jgi:Bacterial surface protein, Ig-like domain/FlgD Ig-like domain/FG-GAP repeat/K319L-like, PKD domain